MAAHLHPSATVVVRRAVAADADDLRRLADLDSTRPLTGAVLVAEADGRILAALDLASGRAIANPFERTAELVALLRMRARAVASPPAGRRAAPLRRPTTA